MYQELIDHSSDLKKLRDEGYEVEIKDEYILVNSIPYVNKNREIKFGTLLSTLCLTGDKTIKPDNHVIYFIGDHPCKNNGTEIDALRHSSTKQKLSSNIVVDRSFSNRPTNGFNDYYEKFTSYINIICSQAMSIDSSVTPKTFKVIASAGSSVLNYTDTNSSRASIVAITQKLEKHKLAIVGLGGTGSYILDLVAKTPVAEVHLFDGDDFFQHNAFRAPGAPSKEKLNEKQKKTDYFQNIYKNMHKNIISHCKYVDEECINDLLTMDFVFICIDTGAIKKEIVKLLVENEIPFIDSGMGVDVVEDSLIGTIRITLSTPSKSDHLKNRISFNSNEDNDEYSTNIQIAELNALNASLAVIKWKKYIGFYQDLKKEHDISFTINDGEIHNEDNQN